MAAFEFEFDGLDGLERDLAEAARRFPVQTEKELVKIAKKFKKSAMQRAEAELNPHERKDPENAISAKWGHKLVDRNAGATVLVYNSARHFHLIENGHNLVKNGQTIGFVPGKHIMEKTYHEYQDIIPGYLENMTARLLGDGGH